MQIETKRFGTTTVGDDEQLEIPDGIPGFRNMRRVVLFEAGAVTGHQVDAGDQSLFWMQDLDDGDLAFLCIVPWSVFPHYDLEIDESELGVVDEHDVRVLNLVTVHRSANGSSLTANLRAPLLIDVRRRRLQQVILADSRWAVNEPIAPLSSSSSRAV